MRFRAISFLRQYLLMSWDNVSDALTEQMWKSFNLDISMHSALHSPSLRHKSLKSLRADFWVFNWRKVPGERKVDSNGAFEVHRGWSRPDLTTLPLAFCYLWSPFLSNLDPCFEKVLFFMLNIHALKIFSFHVEDPCSTIILIQDTLHMHVNRQIRSQFTAREGGSK